MMSETTDMAYVAADPKQPGAAWACIVDDPKWAKDTAQSIAQWVRKGANVMRVDLPTAREMMLKWKRTSKAPTNGQQVGLI